MAHQNKWEKGGLYRKFSDRITGQEVLKLNLGQQGDSRFDDIRYVINDFTEIVDFDFSDIDILKISAVDSVASKSNPHIKLAMISTDEPLLLWIRRYCEATKSSPYECAIFDDLQDAYKWVSR